MGVTNLWVIFCVGGIVFTGINAMYLPYLIKRQRGIAKGAIVSMIITIGLCLVGMLLSVVFA